MGAAMEGKRSFGEFFKARRTALGLTLRRFCQENGLDPGNISKLERGLAAPPRGEKLEAYARALKLRKESDEWYEFFDLAAAEAGRIPKEILEEDQIVAKLPALFRTLRGQKVSDEQIEDLIRLIRSH